MSQLQFFPQFCDDIRHEADGRLSLMGVYPGGVQIDLNGHAAPRICMHATLIIPMSTSVSRVAIRTEWNGTAVHAYELPEEAMLEFMNQKTRAPKDAKVFILNIAAEIKDLKIDGEGVLTAFAEVNDETVKGIPLKITPVRTESDDQKSSA